MASVRIQCVSKWFERRDGESLHVLQNIDFEAPEKSITAIVGASGCGKSTLLNIVAGLVKPDRGCLFLNGVKAADFKDWRSMTYMFQEDRLLPWRTAAQNVAFGLEAAHDRARKDRRDRVQRRKTASRRPRRRFRRGGTPRPRDRRPFHGPVHLCRAGDRLAWQQQHRRVDVRAALPRGPADPHLVVCGAGTGGTSATIGRYIRYRKFPTSLCVADPESSVFHRHYAERSVHQVEACDSVIEGIGRAKVEASFVPDLVDRMIAVPDAASIAAARMTSALLGRACGGSTGTNVWACLKIIEEMKAAGRQGTIVTLLCDSGERYRSTIFNDDWLAGRGLDLADPHARLEAVFGGA